MPDNILDNIAAVVSAGKTGIYLNVHAQPGARKAQLRGMHGDAVKIALREQAQNGKANAALLHFIARQLDLPAADVEIASGHTSRKKRLFLRGNRNELGRRLEAWLSNA
ncbi:MAG: DUF167 domain-containing protein [Mariprofundaceae bacterium]